MAQQNKSQESDLAKAPMTPDEDYLPLPPIICRPLPMPTSHYVARSWVTTALTRLTQRISKFFSAKL